jgi:hypothetical protein
LHQSFGASIGKIRVPQMVSNITSAGRAETTSLSPPPLSRAVYVATTGRGSHDRSQSRQKRIGLASAGLMGHGIGRNILKNDYPLTVLVHRNRKPVDDLITGGAREAKTPRAIAEASDVVFICVTGSPEVEQVVSQTLAYHGH